MRSTRQRRVILEELRKCTLHPTAAEIYDIVRKRLPRISLGTVYRNLEYLSQAGRITTLETAGSQKRFDGRTDIHYHVRCSRCGRVEDAPVGRIDAIDRALEAITGYDVLGYRLEFVGICALCQTDTKDED